MSPRGDIIKEFQHGPRGDLHKPQLPALHLHCPSARNPMREIKGVGGSNPLSPTNLLLINNLQAIKSGMTPRLSTRESDFVKSRSHQY
jgi:hypothetical protein